jgi:hypothetical protein
MGRILGESNVWKMQMHCLQWYIFLQASEWALLPWSICLLNYIVENV